MVINLTIDDVITDGKQITFRAPCDSTNVTGISINNGGTIYAMKDSFGNTLQGSGHFVQGAMISAIIDNTNTAIYILNDADKVYTYGTNDLEAGTSTLETGKLYFVYE